MLFVNTPLRNAIFTKYISYVMLSEAFSNMAQREVYSDAHYEARSVPFAGLVMEGVYRTGRCSP